MSTLGLARAPVVRASATHQPQQQRQAARAAPDTRQRALLSGLAAAAAAAAVSALPLPASALDLSIQSIDLPQIEASEAVVQKKARAQAALDEAEAAFQNSDLLRTLKERSEANRGARKKELEDRYCMRQAELGVGDCGGLRLIPGMTKSGVQKRPEWMENLGQQLGLVKGQEAAQQQAQQQLEPQPEQQQPEQLDQVEQEQQLVEQEQEQQQLE